jgi:pimeloyl-ACP methyl ester carboxylesterase
VKRRGVWVPAVLLSSALAAVALFPAWVAAQARAACVLVTMLDPPVLAGAVRLLTREPQFDDRPVAGIPTVVARPAGQDRRPAIVFANGATPEGRHHPVVLRLARGFARAGFTTYVPELPGLREGEVVSESVAATVAVSRAAAAEAPGGRVALVGVSTGGSLALVAAQSPELAGRVSAVAGAAPYTDIRNVLQLATTGTYREGDEIRPFEPAEGYLALVAGRSLARLVPGRDGVRMSDALRAVPDDDPDPLAVLERLDGEVTTPAGRAVIDLLANRDPRRFDERWSALPREMREGMAQISPADGRRRIDAPVELVSAPRDKYFPVEELTTPRLATRQRVTVTGALQHGDPAASLGKLGDLARLDGFAVRSLRAAAEPAGGG